MEEKDFTPKNRTKKILLRIGLGILGIIVVFFIIIAIILNTVVTPKRVTPILLQLSSEYINADVACESVDITFFSSFPDLGVKLQNGSISSPADTLLAFESLVIAVDPVAFLFEKKVILHQLGLNNANIYAHVDTTGKENWDIFITSGEEKAETDTTTFVMPELNIRNIHLQQVNLIYDDLQQGLFVMVDSLHLQLKGNLSKENADLGLDIQTSGITSYYQGQTFTKNLPLSLNTRLERDRLLKTLAIKEGQIGIGSLELNTNGMLKANRESGISDIDIDFNLNASSLAELMQMIPEHISEIPSKLIAGGKIESSGKITGQLDKDQYPIATLTLKLIDGTLASHKHPKKPFLEDFDVDINAIIDFSGNQPSSLSLNKLYLQTASSKLTAKGEFDHILTNPSIDAEVKADINFTQMSQKLPIEGMKMEGLINCDVSVNCMLDDILTSNYGKINVNGTANIKDVVFNHAEEELSFYTSNADMRFGSNTQDSIRGQLRESLLRGRITLDSLNLNWKKQELLANASKASAVFNTSAPKDTGSIAPVMTAVRVERLRFNMGDSVRFRAVKTSGSVRMQPQTEFPSLPEIKARVSLDSIFGKAYEMGGRISKSNLNITLSKAQARTRNRSSENRQQRDSTRVRSNLTREQRDSLRKIQQDPTTNISFSVESKETKYLLRQWNVSGELTAQDASVRTPYFPIPIRMRESDMKFTTNTLSLAKVHMHLGNSDFVLKGEIEGIRRALLNNGKVTAKMTLEADSMDFNELITAAVTGSEYTQKDMVEKDSISSFVLDETNESKLIAANADTAQLGVFVVPRNLDIEFNTRIKNGRFSDIHIKNTRGQIILRDQAVHLPRFMLNTDIGSTFVTMVYKAPDTKGAHLGFEINVKRINVKELIEAMPVIDELTPMLRSFEGVVDCNITAITELDSMMNIRLPQTTASCYMSGQNLVLLDGETFSEISKMLMFKNKNRNVIDSLSVEMILEEEKLMIFPFQVSMDRYTAAVGGVQNLDMSFNYHITVLKSPVPFKLGLNISGTPDNMKIRLGKAKYKNLFTVAREERLDDTVINLRKEMDEKLRSSIDEIVGAELSRPVRRPRTAIPDSLRRSLFQLEDTVAVSPIATDIPVNIDISVDSVPSTPDSLL
ncbi:MAG: AsmA family protein [Tannerella sp.]|jgi:hypothetical protein|nr:AsmA family protein [Tannerella sp.]